MLIFFIRKGVDVSIQIPKDIRIVNGDLDDKGYMWAGLSIGKCWLVEEDGFESYDLDCSLNNFEKYLDVALELYHGIKNSVDLAMITFSPVTSPPYYWFTAEEMPPYLLYFRFSIDARLVEFVIRPLIAILVMCLPQLADPFYARALIRGYKPVIQQVAEALKNCCVVDIKDDYMEIAYKDVKSYLERAKHYLDVQRDSLKALR